MSKTRRDYSKMGKTGYLRSAEVTHERQAAARRFRRDLLRELGDKAKGAAIREVVESAVSSDAAISVLSHKVLKGRASAWDYDALARMQSQLNRTLRLLGIKFPGVDTEPTEQPGAALAAYLASREKGGG